MSPGIITYRTPYGPVVRWYIIGNRDYQDLSVPAGAKLVTVGTSEAEGLIRIDRLPGFIEAI
jgi:hypothetical protein